jgi:hypothetical protein
MNDGQLPRRRNAVNTPNRRNFFKDIGLAGAVAALLPFAGKKKKNISSEEFMNWRLGSRGGHYERLPHDHRLLRCRKTGALYDIDSLNTADLSNKPLGISYWLK